MGYQNLEQRVSGLTMTTPTFLPIGDETGCSLADLKVTGYEKMHYDEDEEDYVGGVQGGMFVLRLLGATGVAESTYYWIDFGTTPAGWYASSAGAEIDGGAEAVFIEVGRAAWITGNGHRLTTAGLVGTKDTGYTTKAVGLTAVGNCTPVDLTLGKLYVNGYSPMHYDEGEEDYVGGVQGGTFVLRLLGPTGAAEATYYWIDFGVVTANWYASSTGDAIAGGAASVSIPAGKGLWITGGGNKLNIPAPEL